MVVNSSAQNKKECEAKKTYSYSEFNVLESGDTTKTMILFLHGAGSDSEMWENHIKVLESDYYCIAPDLPGHGGSNHLSWTSIEQVGDELVSMIRNKTSKKIVLVGFSLGGSLAFYLLERYPELICKAIIDGASARPIKGYAFVIQLMSPFLKSNFILNAMAKSLGIKKSERASFKKSIKNADRKSFKRSMIQANKFNLKNNEFAKTIPVLYASGEKESETMHQSHIELSKSNSRSHCVQYPEKGHAWMVFDIETHVSMISNWILDTGDIPNKLRIMKNKDNILNYDR